MAKIFIIYYSMYGHIKAMAQKVKEGVDNVDGCEGTLYQVAETLPEEVLAKMYAPPKDPDVPIITAADLEQCDGILFGIPTRYGMAAAQMKAFWDSTGGLWQAGKLIGKPAGIFFSTAVQVGMAIAETLGCCSCAYSCF
jgi:NAD(P)H dehydrogenase (quinone)